MIFSGFKLNNIEFTHDKSPYAYGVLIMLEWFVSSKT